MTDFHKPGQPGQAAALPETYVQHPLSAAFPRMTPEEFQELKDSIEVLGVQNPITLHDGMVIDGWHRYTAARELDLPCPVVELAQDIDPRDFVMAQNKARRHVTKGQLAIATTAVYAWKPPHREKAHTECDLPAKTNSELASIAGVHPNSITQAKAVTTQAAPAVVEAVKRGELGLPKAAAIAKLPREQQAQAISKPLPRPVVVVPPPPSSAAPDPWASLPKGDNTVPEDVNPDDYGPSEEEIAAAEAQDKAERELVAKMIAADDVVAELAAEVKRLTALNEGLTRRIDSLMREKSDAITWMKKYEAQNRRLFKELEALKKGGAQ